MPRNRRSSWRSDTGADLTPLVDVVFLMLIFFMLTTSFLQNAGLRVELPQARGEQLLVPSENVIEIEIDRQGNYQLDSKPLPAASMTELMRSIAARAGEDRSLAVVISADARTAHASVVRAMDALQRLGFKRLSIATTTPPPVESTSPASRAADEQANPDSRASTREPAPS